VSTRILGVPINVVAWFVVIIAGALLIVRVTHGRPFLEAVVLTSACIVAAGLAGMMAWVVVLPTSDRRALEAIAWCAERGRARFLALSNGRYSHTPAGIKRYVRTTAERPDDDWVRVEYHVMMGDLATARDLVEKITPLTPRDRVEQAADLDWIDWIAGGSGDLDLIRSALEQVPRDDSDERIGAELALAMAEVRSRLSGNVADPARPLRTLRDRLGHRADGLLFKQAFRQLPTYLSMVGVVAIVGAVLDRV
jgi:hypothetical protein